MTQKAVAGSRVLVVEDEALVVMMLETMLDELGCVVAGVAGDLELAKRAIETPRVDCALLDINLSGRPVYPLAHLLKARGIPFVFVTGYDRPDLPEGFTGRPVLRKPFDLASLERTLAAALGGPGGLSGDAR